MGWTTLHLGYPVKEFLMNEFTNDNVEALDVAIVKLKTAYLAVRNKKKGYVFGVVVMLEYYKDYYNFGFKEIDEFCGPVKTECPKRILDLLTPIAELKSKITLSEDSLIWAEKWRSSCLNKSKAKTFKSGMTIKVKHPISFSNGKEYQYFKKKGKQIYAIIGYGFDNSFELPVRIKGMNSKEFEVIE